MGCMRFREFIQSKSFLTVASFVVLAGVATQFPSPWQDGPLLDLRPELPPGITNHPPLIQFPEVGDEVDDPAYGRFVVPLDLPSEDEADDTITAPERVPSPVVQTASTNDDSRPVEASSPPETASDVHTPSDRTAEASALLEDAAVDARARADVDGDMARHPTVDSAVRVGAETVDSSSLHEATHAAVASTRIVHPDPSLRVPAATSRPLADPRDAQLLDAVRRMRAALPARGGHLTIPCRVRYASEDEAADEALATKRIADALHSSCETWALDHFYTSLRARALGQKGLTRWSQFGDSLVVGDTMTGELRRLFQQQFGDGGHGFIYIGQPLRAFGFENIRVGASDAWDTRTIVRHAAEGGGTFGLGGAEFRARDASSISIQSPRDGEIGKDIQYLDVLYSTPSGTTTGTFRVTSDGATHTERFDTVPEQSGLQRVEVPRGEHRVSLFGFTPSLRFHGVISETDGPGVVVDNIGQVSAREEHLLKIDPDHWRQQLHLRDPDVVSFFYGVNAASSNGARLEGRGNYAANYREVLRRATDGASQRDCLVMSLLTRGTREGGSISPTGAVAVLNRAQRRAALASGCAFFDTTALMGGPDGTKKWADGKPTLLGADLAHPTPAGYREIARRLYADVLDGFIAYLERRIEQSGGPR